MVELYVGPIMRSCWLVGIVFAVLAGCSSSADYVVSPVTPPANGISISGLGETGHRNILIAGSLYIDSRRGKVGFNPFREMPSHWNVTELLAQPKCSDCVKLALLDWRQASDYIKFSVTLKNPTHLPGYDVRGIIIPKIEGFRLINPDGYTGLWDDGGPVTVNPFKAFAADQPQRRFEPGSKHSRIYAIRYPSYPDLLEVDLLVDASWPGNCEEPYSLTNFIQEKPLTNDGTPGQVQLDVLDWQNDVSSLELDLGPIGGNKISLSHAAGSTWQGSIFALLGTPPGVYDVRATAKSSGSTTESINFFPVTVNPVPASPKPGPVWLNTVDIPGEAMDVVVEGNYAYIAAGYQGLVVVDISVNPPEVVGQAPTGGDYLTDIEIHGGYAYAQRWSVGLEVFEIKDPANPLHLASPGIDCSGDLEIENDRLYTLWHNWPYPLTVYDLGAQGDLKSAGTLYLPSAGSRLDVSNGLACVTSNDVVYVVDVSVSAQMKVVATPDEDHLYGYRDVALDQGVAYVVGGSPGLTAFDLSDPASPVLLGTSDYGGSRITVCDSIVYLVAGSSLRGLDISSPGFPCVSTVGLPSNSMDLDISQDGMRGWVASYLNGLQTVDLSNTGCMLSLGSMDYGVPAQHIASRMVGDHLFSALYGVPADYGGPGVLAVADISTPSDPVIESLLPLGGWPLSIQFSGGFLALSSQYSGVELIDFARPEDPVIVSRAPDLACGSQVIGYGNRLFVAAQEEGVVALNVDEPCTPSLAWTVSLPGVTCAVACKGSYLYAASGEGYLNVIDFSDEDDAHLITSLQIPGSPKAIVLVQDMAYMADGLSGLAVVDLGNPVQPELLKSVDLPGFAWTVEYSGDFLYVACMDSGTQVLSISDPTNPRLHCSAVWSSPTYHALPYGSLVAAANGLSGTELLGSQ